MQNKVVGVKCRFEQPKGLNSFCASTDCCWFLQISNAQFKKQLEHFQNFRATKKTMNTNTVHLTDSQINIYNEQLVSLMNSIHSELKLIIEDELFSLLQDSMLTVN